MEGDVALLSWIDNPALAYNIGRKSLCTATHTNVPLVILPDLDVFAGCIHLQQVPKLLLVHFQVGHSDRVVDQVILINEPEGLSHGSWDDALLIFIDGSWQREAQAHGEQGMSREPKLAGDRVRSEACLQHTSAGKEQPHNSPTAQPLQPGLHILQDLWANPIPLLCWNLAKLLVSKAASSRRKKAPQHFSVKHHACSYSVLFFEASMTPQLFPALRSFNWFFFGACSLLVSGHSTPLSEFKCFSFCLQQPCKMAIHKFGAMVA